MRVAVYGAGAIGGWIAVLLTRAGHDVSVVARGRTLEAVQRNGLTLVSEGRTMNAKVRASASASEIGVQDLVVISVKATSMREVGEGIGPLISANTCVLSAMNGVPWWFSAGLPGAMANIRLASVDPDGVLARAIPIDQTMGCVVYASCSSADVGVAVHHRGNSLQIGEAVGGISDRSIALASALCEAGFDAKASAFIQREAWYKLWGNMTLNPLSAITGATTDRILDDELLFELSASSMLEAKRIGERIGISIDERPQDRLATTRKLGKMRTSMLQDIEAGRQLELDALVGAVTELGTKVHVPTPFTNALLGIARLRAQTARQP